MSGPKSAGSSLDRRRFCASIASLASTGLLITWKIHASRAGEEANIEGDYSIVERWVLSPKDLAVRKKISDVL